MRVYLSKKDLSIIYHALDSLLDTWDKPSNSPDYEDITALSAKIDHNRNLMVAAKARVNARAKAGKMKQQMAIIRKMNRPKK